MKGLVTRGAAGAAAAGSCLFILSCTVLLEGSPRSRDGSEDFFEETTGDAAQEPDPEPFEPVDHADLPPDPDSEEQAQDPMDTVDDETQDSVGEPDAACDTFVTLGEIDADRDTYINQWDAETPFGAEDRLSTARNEFNIYRKILVAFDLSSVPSGSVIASAELALHCISWSDDTGGSVGVYEVTSAWDENTVTWNTAPHVSESILDSTVIDLNAYNTWDITNLVRDWHAGTRPNHGVMLYSDAYDNYSFASHENTVNEYPPQLRITIEYCP